jgi:hypothetical protein
VVEAVIDEVEESVPLIVTV